MAVDWDQYDLGKVAIAILIPVVCVAFWWFGSQQLSLPVQQNAIPSATPSASIIGASTIEPQPSQTPLQPSPTDPNGWRPDYSATTRSPTPTVVVQPTPTPSVFLKKETYAVEDLRWLVPKDDEMRVYGLVCFNSSSANVSVNDISYNFSAFFSAELSAVYSGGVLGKYPVICVYFNGTLNDVPSSIKFGLFNSSEAAASQVVFNATSYLVDLGSANVGDKSVIFRVDADASVNRSASYRVKFSKKNVFVSLTIAAVRGDESRLDALAIAQLIDGKI